MVDNYKYHHVIDPNTGYPVKTNLLSVTTFTKNSVQAEIECKRLFSPENLSRIGIEVPIGMVRFSYIKMDMFYMTVWIRFYGILLIIRKKLKSKFDY